MPQSALTLYHLTWHLEAHSNNEAHQIKVDSPLQHLSLASWRTSRIISFSWSSCSASRSASLHRRFGVPAAIHTGCCCKYCCCSGTLMCLANSFAIRQACRTLCESTRVQAGGFICLQQWMLVLLQVLLLLQGFAGALLKAWERDRRTGIICSGRVVVWRSGWIAAEMAGPAAMHPGSCKLPADCKI